MDKAKIARNFSRSASTYDAHADLQRELAKELIGMVVSLKIKPQNILDIGTGTGEVASLLHEKFRDAHITGCDIAPGMVKKAIQKNTGADFSFDIADAEALPYSDDSFDLVVSSTTYQWVDDLAKAFAEAKRVLAPGGAFAFITLGPKTLTELKRSFRSAVDKSADHFHTYKNSRQIHGLMKQTGFSSIKVSSRVMTKIYPNFRTFFRTLKGIGALNASPSRPKGLMGKAKMDSLSRTYEANCRMGKGVYASYEVVTALCRKI